MSAHSEFGPSSFYKRILCPGSYNAEKDLPQETSTFAQEGTDAHELAEICLTQKRTARSFIGKSPLINKERVIDEDMAHFVQQYIDYVLSIGGDQEYEQEVSYDEWIPGGFGTADVIAVEEDTLHVIDLKYGKGVEVHADR